MNIQIFGTKKCNDTKKAERFFKERGIKYQFIDMKEKGMSKGEFTSFNSHPRFPFCKRVSHFESDLQILYPTFHFCNDFPVFSLAFMI